MPLKGTLKSAWVLLMELMQGFLPFLSWLASTRIIPSTLSHQQASFHLSMRQTIMSKAETQITPPTPPHPHPRPHHRNPHPPIYLCSYTCFFTVHLTSLINTHTPCTALSFFFPISPPVSPPIHNLSNLAGCTPWAYSAESNASLFLFGSHSSATVRSHSHLACLLEMGLSGIPTLPFPNRIIENGTARANKKKERKRNATCSSATLLYPRSAFSYMNKTQPVVFQGGGQFLQLDWKANYIWKCNLNKHKLC